MRKNSFEEAMCVCLCVWEVKGMKSISTCVRARLDCCLIPASIFYGNCLIEKRYTVSVSSRTHLKK